MQSDTTTYEKIEVHTQTGKCNGQIEQRFEDDGLKDWSCRQKPRKASSKQKVEGEKEDSPLDPPEDIYIYRI